MNTHPISPFTTTPGIAGDAYINIGYADEIIANFESPYSTQYVYKILGLRGSGKSVEYKKVMDYFSEKKEWKVYSVAAGGNPTLALLSSLTKEKELHSELAQREYTENKSLAANAGIFKGEISIKKTQGTDFPTAIFSAESELEYALKLLCQKGYNILIGIDDIASTESMIEFLSILGKLILLPTISLRLIATGLEKNIEEFVDIPHLSFFARPKPFFVTTLNLHDVTRMYQNLLGLDTTDARNLAEISEGYAWGYQLLGDEFFHKKESESLEEVLRSFDLRMAPTYDLVWNSLTPAERKFIISFYESKTKTNTELSSKIKGFSQHRNNLKKKHIIDTSEVGYIKINLPRFEYYIKNEWLL